MKPSRQQAPVVAAAPAPPEAPPESADGSTGADPMPTSGMVCLLLPDDTAAALDKAFPAPEGATIPAPRHITLAFLGSVADLERTVVEAAIAAALSESDEEEDEEASGEGSPEDTDTISGTFAGWARFAAESDEDGNEGGALTPIVALFDSPDLVEIQATLSEALEDVGMPEPTHGFTSHSTMFRVDLADTDSIPMPAPPMLAATFSEIALVWGDYTDPANVTLFPIASPDQESAPEEEEAPMEEPMMAAATTLGATGGSVSDKPWDGSAGRFTDEQYQRAAAACDPASKGTVKSRCFLPHHEPGGAVNRNGVHAAAQRVGSLSGRSPDAVAKAKGHLHRHYTTDLKEDPPDSVLSAVTAGAAPPLDGIPTPLPVPEWEALILTEGEPTDDGRTVAPGALSWRPLPISFTFQPIDSQDAHDDAPVGGAITEIARDGNAIMARGIYAQGPLGETCRAMVDDPGMPLAPSIRMADDSMTMQINAGPGGQNMTVLDGLLLNFCLVPVEAQASTWIRNLAPALPMMPEMPMEPMMASACACDDSRDSWRFTGALIACAAGNGAPVHPPEWWFDFPPELDSDGPPMALQITAEGRVFGHLAGPGCHLAKPGQCLTVGATSKDFTLFHHGGDDPEGGILTAEGTRIRVGALTMSGGHASLRASADEAMAHYDDPDRVGAFFRAGWDGRRNLPYVAGAVLPRVSEEDLQIMRALGVSGDWRIKEDWRTIDGKRTLVGLALVPVPGWPQVWRQAVVASGALVAEVVDTFGALRADIAEEEPEPAPEPVAASAWLLEAAADGMAAEVLREPWAAEAASLAEIVGVK